MSSIANYPISALVGCEELTLALVLCAVDPAIGGVLLRGEKGSAKTTAARGLAAILADDAPFVEVPLGASEDRVVGSLDLKSVLSDGEYRFQPGILSNANGGVLYIDEVNLLADHLVDVLLDVAVSGVSRVERDGISHEHPSRFVLVGSMNPEEGELRPQLLDRFGLSVNVTAPKDPELRAEAVRRRIAFDADPKRFLDRWALEQDSLISRLSKAEPVPLESGLDERVAKLCSVAGAEGLRADLVICRAAAALAGWEGKTSAGIEEVVRVAPMALSHRRGSPFTKNLAERPGLDDLLEEMRSDDGRSTSSDRPSTPGHPGESSHPGESNQPGDSNQPGESGGRGEPESDGEERVVGGDYDGPASGDEEGGSLELGGVRDANRAPFHSLVEKRRLANRRGRSSYLSGARGKRLGGSESAGRVVSTGVVMEEAASNRAKVSAVGTVVAAISRNATAAGPERSDRVSIAPEDLRAVAFEAPVASLVIFVVDASGSMGARERIEAAKAALMGILANAYEHRDRVALIAVKGEGAEVVVRPTGSVEVAKARLEGLRTGGKSPLAAGLRLAVRLAEESREKAYPLIVLVSDGRATWAEDGVDPVEAAMDASDEIARKKIDAVVVDCEGGGTKLGLSRRLAERMGAHLVSSEALEF